jgi:ribonuclease G
MNKELYVSSTPHETKVALAEDDQLAEVFYERENEYTLAGSIYKGRVTRVLPGMQSAFVDIGLERDAFLYVSDFMELTDEEDAEEFGDIPASVPPIIAGRSSEPEVRETVPASQEPMEPVATGDGAAETDQERGSQTDDSRVAEGARRWRGRRRRGGRRGGQDERFQRNEPRNEATETTTKQEREGAAPEERPTPSRYVPIVLPGESISKYRNLAKAAPETETHEEDIVEEETTDAPELSSAAPIEDFLPPVETGPAEVEEISKVEQEEIAPAEVITEVLQGKEATPVEAVEEKREPLVTVSDVEVQPVGLVTSEVMDAVHGEPATEMEAVESTDHGTIDFGTQPIDSNPHPAEISEAAGHDPVAHRHSAPSEAPEGRTLEHETLDDDEMEFHPMPENLEAIREVAGDFELELEEETLDSDNGYSDRWIPKVADVDEDEVVAAEERGETRLTREEQHEEEEDEDEENNDRAEVRAAAPTAAYQQRQTKRNGEYERRGQRGFRGRRNNVRTNAHRPQPLISDLLKEGQEILIQIAKEPIAKKGARITSHIALPGRFLVYMPTVNHVGVSRKINSEEERQRLKRIVTSERENGIGGFIVRTAAANIKEDELRADIRFLKHLWAEIKNRADDSKSPALNYHDLNLVERVLRDQVNADFSQIWVDTEEEYERVIRFAQRFQPSLVRRIKLYTKSTPLFENFGIQDEINNALKSKVWLKSGGYIVINQTEALVAIDINTGKYVGKTLRLEDTIVKTNIEAIKEIVRQVRLRDLGGIIVIDFIDMDERKNRQKVMQALEEALRTDRAPSKALQFNDFGLVAITRKRVKQSLERTLGEACPYCTGAGFVKSVPTICNEIYIEMRKMIKAHDRTDVTLRVNPEVAKALKASNGKLITEMEELIGKTVLVKSDALLHQEHFDIQ